MTATTLAVFLALVIVGTIVVALFARLTYPGGRWIHRLTCAQCARARASRVRPRVIDMASRRWL